MKILVPGWTSPEAGYLFLVAASLVARTYCDIWMIQNGTFIERYVTMNCFGSRSVYAQWFEHSRF